MNQLQSFSQEEQTMTKFSKHHRNAFQPCINMRMSKQEKLWKKKTKL